MHKSNQNNNNIDFIKNTYIQAGAIATGTAAYIGIPCSRDDLYSGGIFAYYDATGQTSDSTVLGIFHFDNELEAVLPITSMILKAELFNEATFSTLPTAEILNGKNARAWVLMVLYLKNKSK